MLSTNNSTNASTAPYLHNYTPEEKEFSRRKDWSTEHLKNSWTGNDLHRAEFDSVWLARTLSTFEDKDSTEQWRIATAYRRFLEQHREPATAARLYFANFADFVHDKFKYSPRQDKIKAKKLLQPGKWGYKLFSRLPAPYFYSLSMKNLGLSEAYADSRFIYYTVVIEEIKASLRRKLLEPLAWKIEVGKAGNVHTHAIGPHSTALDFLQESERMKPIQAGTEANVIAYMLKPVAPWSENNYATFLQARAENQASRLSPLSGNYGLGNARTVKA